MVDFSPTKEEIKMCSDETTFFHPQVFEKVETMADKEKKEEEEEATIAEDIVVTKYKMAGEIVNSKFIL